MKKRLIYTVLSSIESAVFFKGIDPQMCKDFTGAIFTNMQQLKNAGLTEEDRLAYKDELSKIAMYFIEHLVVA